MAPCTVCRSGLHKADCTPASDTECFDFCPLGDVYVCDDSVDADGNPAPVCHCDPCPADSYCTLGTETPAPCRVCTAAEIETAACSAQANTQCVPLCHVGEKLVNSSLCELCDDLECCAGRLHAAAAITPGVLCDKGAGTLSACPAGQFCPGHNVALDCGRCAPGQFVEPPCNATHNVTCPVCPAGSRCDGVVKVACAEFQESPAGATACTCVPGWYGNGSEAEPGAEPCQECEVGHYCFAGLRTRCPYGLPTTFRGASSQADCVYAEVEVHIAGMDDWVNLTVEWVPEGFDPRVLFEGRRPEGQTGAFVVKQIVPLTDGT
eukprot:3937833-Rhodomonas_salina.1